MKLHQILVVFLHSLILNGSCMEHEEYTDPLINKTHPDKDLYVIHATVYQVGILTNRTDNMTNDFNSTANQESLTLFHTNGSNIDLSDIPEPFLTNVTAESMVGVAPVTSSDQNVTPFLGDLSMLPHPLPNNKYVNSPVANKDDEVHNPTKRSTSVWFRLFKRDTANNPVKVINGTALIPPEAGVQSIALPPLLALNNNLSSIPVPIPNTSVVHYAKVNTLIQKP